MFIYNLNKISNRLYMKVSLLIFKLNTVWDFPHVIQYYLKLSFFMATDNSIIWKPHNHFSYFLLLGI